METVIRVAIIFVFLTAALRFIGKRELGELSPFELILIMIIPEIVSQGLIRDDYSVTNAIIGVSTLLSLVTLNSFLTYRFNFFKKVVEGQPVILFYQGEFVEGVLDRERIGPDEVLSEIRSSGYESFDQMKWIVLEPGGKISCIPYENAHRSGKEG